MRISVMKIVNIILIAAIVACCSCAANQVGRPYDVTHKKNTMAVGDVIITYSDSAMLYHKKRNELNNSTVGADTKRSTLANIPKGGRITILIKRPGMNGANTKNFEYIVNEHGKELFRQQGKNQIAKPPHNDRLWWNLDVVLLQQPIKDSITLYVSDGMGSDEFTIKKNGEVTGNR